MQLLVATTHKSRPQESGIDGILTHRGTRASWLLSLTWRLSSWQRRMGLSTMME